MNKMDKTVLIVDDEVDILDSMFHFLSRRFEECLTATDGAEALWVCANKTVDLLFTDMVMPNLNGLELIRVVREKYPYIYPIAVISGHATECELQEVRDMGIPIFHKPVDMCSLMEHVCSTFA